MNLDNATKAAAELARRHAARSAAPQRFMNSYDDKLQALLAKGEEALIHRVPTWHDPVHLAAEVEALCAFRSMMRRAGAQP